MRLCLVRCSGPLKLSRAQREPYPDCLREREAEERRRVLSDDSLSNGIKTPNAEEKSNVCPDIRDSLRGSSFSRLFDEETPESSEDYRGAFRSASRSGVSPQTRLLKITAKARLGGTKRSGSLLENNHIPGAPVAISRINGECENRVVDRYKVGLFWFCVAS